MLREKNGFYLPPIKGREYTLILDLDETLVHYDDVQERLHIRPGAANFVIEMAKYYEVVIFTAGMKDYADWALKQLGTASRYIRHRLYR